jgi:hypothetical protein
MLLLSLQKQIKRMVKKALLLGKRLSKPEMKGLAGGSIPPAGAGGCTVSCFPCSGATQYQCTGYDGCTSLPGDEYGERKKCTVSGHPALDYILDCHPYGE